MFICGDSISEITLAGEKVIAENVGSVTELSEADLSDIPVVIYINSSDSRLNKKIIRPVIGRDDISIRQIFFRIDPKLNKTHIERLISDLGIKSPNIINGIGDALLEDYFEVYPLTNYIKRFLDIFREKVSELQSVLDAENEKNRKNNSEIHYKINNLENDIRFLKYADELFMQRDNLDTPAGFDESFSSLVSRIYDWRKKKIKTASREDAEKMAAEFDCELEKIYADFVEQIDNAAVKKSNDIDAVFAKWFGDTKAEPDYSPALDFKYEAKQIILPRLYNEFLKLKTEQYVSPKGNIFDIFKNGKANEEQEKILETTYSFESWKIHAEEVLRPICQKVIDDWTMVLSKYYSSLANVYHNHITELINSKTDLKNKAAMQLSDDDKKLQDDNDWFTELKDKLRLIERG